MINREPATHANERHDALNRRLFSCQTSEEMTKAIRDGADPNARDDDGRTPLHRFCRYGALDMVKTLVGLGADIHARDINGSTPLHRAMPRHPTKCEPDVITLVHECYILRIPHAIIHVTHNPIARLLIERGADVNAVDYFGRTPLHYSVAVSVTKHLLDSGADPMLRDNFGMTALEFLDTEMSWRRTPPARRGRLPDAPIVDLGETSALLSKAMMERELFPSSQTSVAAPAINRPKRRM